MGEGTQSRLRVGAEADLRYRHDPGPAFAQLPVPLGEEGLEAFEFGGHKTSALEFRLLLRTLKVKLDLRRIDRE